MTEHDAGRARRAEQRVEHRARAIGDGEELARFFALELHAELAEEGDGRGHVEAAQDLADGGRSRAVERGARPLRGG